MNEEFFEWLRKKKRRKENTIKMYKRYLKELPEIDLVNMPEEEIRGIINSKLVEYPNQVAKSACASYIKFLFTKLDHSDPVFFEKMRVKKNNILSNLEVTDRAKSYKLDLEKHYISKIRFLNVLKALKSKKIRKILILLYDADLRANELLLNDWKNIDENGIFIPKSISKSGRDGYVEWVMDISKSIIRDWKKKYKGIFGKSLGIKYSKLYYILSKKKLGDNSIRPHQLRHTGLTDLAGEGWELGKLQRRARHSDPKITQDYISWTANRKGKIELLDRYCKKNGIDLEGLI